MGNTKIEYLDKSWNPLAMRCTPCSPGCEHCWHLRMADRLAGKCKKDKWAYPFKEAYEGSGPPIITGHLEDPLHWKKPARIGVQFMGDLFHENVDSNSLISIFRIIRETRKHKFIILTKRPERMNTIFLNIRSYFNSPTWSPYSWENLWLGVTVCNQEEADQKIPILLQIPAAHRWVSYEPALGPVDFCSKEIQISHPDNEGYGVEMIKGLDWIVAGTETGPGARPADNEWFRSIAQQCRSAGVPYFQKATTGPTPEDLMIREYPE